MSSTHDKSLKRKKRTGSKEASAFDTEVTTKKEAKAAQVVAPKKGNHYEVSINKKEEQEQEPKQVDQEEVSSPDVLISCLSRITN